MKICGLGEITRDEKLGWLVSNAVPLQVFNGHRCQLIFDGYEEDSIKDDYHEAAQQFLALQPAALKTVEEAVYQYYTDTIATYVLAAGEYIQFSTPSEIWSHVAYGDEALLRRRDSDQKIYISIECECDWEQEHGLQIVFQEGKRINKVGPYDDHLTNTDAYGDETLENVVYHSLI